MRTWVITACQMIKPKAKAKWVTVWSYADVPRKSRSMFAPMCHICTHLPCWPPLVWNRLLTVPSVDPTFQLWTKWINKRLLVCMSNESYKGSSWVCPRCEFTVPELIHFPKDEALISSQLHTKWINKRLLLCILKSAAQGSSCVYPRHKYLAPGYMHVAEGNLSNCCFESELLRPPPRRKCQLMLLSQIAALPHDPTAANFLLTLVDAPLVLSHIHAVGSSIHWVDARWRGSWWKGNT